LLQAAIPARAAGETGKVDRDAFKDFQVSPEVLKAAMVKKVPLRGENKLQNGPQKEAYAVYLNALLVSLNPELKEPDGQLVKEVLLAQIRSLLVGGQEPNAGAGLNGWTHSALAQAFVLVKKTPEVWTQLTDDEKSRMDWLMKAMAVAGHWDFDDGNDFHTSLHCDDNHYKKWNPNHRLYLFVVLSAAAYFGPDELNKIFTSFDFDEYMKKFDEYGFTNIKAVWTCYDWKTIFEKGGTYTSPKNKVEKNSGAGVGSGTGVRHPFTYEKIPLANIADIYCSVAEFNYCEKVIDGIEGKSWILNNGTSPFLGQAGMMREFNGNDASGRRSSLHYCNEDFCGYTPMLMTLKVLGLWPDSERCRNLEKLMYVGNEDFLYKNATGFHTYQNGAGEDAPKLESQKWLSYPFVREIWNGYLKAKLKPA